jgi:5'-methylthioadenosine phosphorylase/5'-methylthioinosine phosphorylase
MGFLAIIGGSGLNRFAALESPVRQSVETEFGRPSAPLVVGKLQGYKVVFLARHGDGHSIAPHQINYRANIRALQTAGVTHIVSVAAVGGIGSHLPPAQIAVPEQLIDYTHGRKSTFYEGSGSEVKHIDLSWPYSRKLASMIERAAGLSGLKIVSGGTYGCTQGPRLETGAEILRMERDGCDMVGMTGMPEAALAREAGIDYACCAVMANWAAGKSSSEITRQEIEANLSRGMVGVANLLGSLVGVIG